MSNDQLMVAGVMVRALGVVALGAIAGVTASLVGAKSDFAVFMAFVPFFAIAFRMVWSK